MDLRRQSIPTSISIAVLGAPNVGKTSFVTRFLDGTFPPGRSPTSQETFVRFVQTSGGSYQQIQVVDTHGIKKDKSATDEYIKDSDAFVVIYSVDKRKSLKKAIKMCRRVLDIKDSPDTPILLVGNKCDHKCETPKKTEKRNKYIQNRISCFHMESSAKTNQNVRLIFDIVIEHMQNKALKDTITSLRKRSRVSQCVGNGDHRPPGRISKVSIETIMGFDKPCDK
ncbi:ras-related protein Rap-1b-like [Haliotis rubra]|uniref:ras-related protein Rap-1b-like n=1 Tax=Haliotis rubra TaxID=36100 RepID=UPI001EE52E75|nr:ras-related protein Rap-1b-like [Haliotis rubra]